MFGLDISVPSYIYSMVLAFIFSMAVNGVMYFQLKKIDMIESLKVWSKPRGKSYKIRLCLHNEDFELEPAKP